MSRRCIHSSNGALLHGHNQPLVGPSTGAPRNEGRLIGPCAGETNSFKLRRRTTQRETENRGSAVGSDDRRSAGKRDALESCFFGATIGDKKPLQSRLDQTRRFETLSQSARYHQGKAGRTAIRIMVTRLLVARLIAALGRLVMGRLVMGRLVMGRLFPNHDRDSNVRPTPSQPSDLPTHDRRNLQHAATPAHDRAQGCRKGALRGGDGTRKSR